MNRTHALPFAGALPRAVLAVSAALTMLAGMLVLPNSAAPAQAASSSETIVYLKNYNVWIARGDGSGQRHVTTVGSFATPWLSPTQSDTGVIVAVRGEKLYRMDQWGRVKNTIDPPALTNTIGQRMDGRIDEAAISPDGSKIAYTFTAWGCVNPGSGCMFRSATSFTDAGALTPPSKYGVTQFGSPSWVTNTRVIVHGGYLAQMNLHDLATRQTTYWFDDYQHYEPSTDLSNADVSRDGKHLVVVRGYENSQHIFWYRINGDVRTGGKPPLPTPLCGTNENARFTNPVWDPSGTVVTFEEASGITVIRNATAGACGDQAADLILGGSAPSWSKASLSTNKPVSKLSVTKKPKIIGKAKVGRTLKTDRGKWSATPSSYSYQWYRNGKKIAGSKAKKSKYKVTRKDRGKRLTIKVTAKRSGYTSASSTSKSVRVKR